MKFLIIKTSSLGDIVHCFPVIAYLKEKFSEVRIDWVVESTFADLIKAHPDIHSIYSIDSKRWRKSLFEGDVWEEVRALRKKLRQEYYDVIFDLQGNLKSAGCTFMSSGKDKVGFGYKTVSEWPNILFTDKRYNPPSGKNIREDYLFLIQSYFEDYTRPYSEKLVLKITAEEKGRLALLLKQSFLKGREKILICTGSNWRNKQMTEEAWVDFLRRLSNQKPCSFLFTWGNEREKQEVLELQKVFPKSLVIDKLSLPLLQNLMAHMDLVVAMDSLPLHLAGTTDTPTFSVFGASLASKYAPLGEKHTSFQGECPYGVVFPRRCPYLRRCKTGACIRSLSGEKVYKAFAAVD